MIFTAETIYQHQTFNDCWMVFSRFEKDGLRFQRTLCQTGDSQPGMRLLKQRGGLAVIGCSPSVCGEVIVPDGVTEINENAFYGCTGITRIRLPNGLQTIQEYAFDGCSSLQELVIPASVESADIGILFGCSSLRRLIFEAADWHYSGYDWFLNESAFTGSLSTAIVVCAPVGSAAEQVARDRGVTFAPLC